MSVIKKDITLKETRKWIEFCETYDETKDDYLSLGDLSEGSLVWCHAGWNGEMDDIFQIIKKVNNRVFLRKVEDGPSYGDWQTEEIPYDTLKGTTRYCFSVPDLCLLSKK